MTIFGVKSEQLLFLVLVILKGYQAFSFQRLGNRDYEVWNVHSTREIDTFLNGSSNYFYIPDCCYVYGSSVQKLVIGQNSTLNAIPTKLFEQFSSLDAFSASDVSLEELKVDDFSSAQNLEYLILSSNKIRRLNNLVFSQLKGLVEVDLSSNEISFVDANAFEGLSRSLRKIDLSNNKIKKFMEHSLILLLEGIRYRHDFISLNLANNEIEEVLPSNKTLNEDLPQVHLDLFRNKLKAFECTAIKYTSVNLSNNDIKTINPRTSIFQVDLRKNNITELIINFNVSVVNASDNQITKFSFDNRFQLDTLILSRNKIESLLPIKGQHFLRTLDLSENEFTTLNADTFADLHSLETLRLDQNRISNIGFKVFEHQENLISLNISYNALNSIDWHVFGTLSSLVHIDISGNNLSSIEGYEEMGQILPRLYTIELNMNLWGCRYLSKMKNNLEIQRIFIKNPNKHKNNVAGIQCTEDSDSTASHEVNFNVTNVEDITRLAHKINEQNVEIAKFKIETEKLFMSEKDKLFKSAPTATTEISNTGNGFTRLEIFFIVSFLIALIFFSVLQAKKIVNFKLDPFSRQRVSRRNSVSTIVTYDNTNMV